MTPKPDPKTAQTVLKKWGLKRAPRLKSGREIFIKTLKGTAENEDWVSLALLDVSWASLGPLLTSFWSSS